MAVVHESKLLCALLKPYKGLICYNSKMPELTEIVGDCSLFMDRILSEITEQGFDLHDFSQMDHMCYRTISMSNYAQKKAQLQEVAQLLRETLVNGRPISIFRLNAPVIHKDWRVDVVELSAPKAGSDYKEGLEHAELVLFDDMPTFLQKYKDKTFEMKSADRGINPEIGFKLTDGITVKFHLLCLSTVAYLENKLGIDEVND